MQPRRHVPQIVAFAVALALATGASADGHHDDRHRPPSVHREDHRGVVWGHGDIRHFHDFDDHAWRGGHWVHDWHDNHFGWWWIVGGAWVFFNAPIYPYPDPYVPSTVIVQQAPPPAPAAPPSTGPAPAAGVLVLLRVGAELLPLRDPVSGGLAAGAGHAAPAPRERATTAADRRQQHLVRRQKQRPRFDSAAFVRLRTVDGRLHGLFLLPVFDGLQRVRHVLAGIHVGVGVDDGAIRRDHIRGTVGIGFVVRHH